MIATFVVGLALTYSSGDLINPVLLRPKAACRLATTEKILSGKSYRIRGKYFADGMHSSELDLPECNVGLNPELDGAALARITNFHNAFQVKCGTWLNGDSVVGEFTGHFVRRRARLYGMSAPTMVNFFVITEIETNDEDTAPITCGDIIR